LDDVSKLICSYSHPAGNFDRDGGDASHHRLDNLILELDRPGNSRERKTNREGEMPDPTHSTGPIKRE
jgi:hypothetical protein